MEQVYEFKVTLKYDKNLWRKIQIKDTQTLARLDHVIRESFKHDLSDHVSEFFRDRVKRYQGFGAIYPDWTGPGAEVKIYQLGLSEGDKMEYVYDFGENIRHIVVLKKIIEPEKDTQYPRIIAQNEPKYEYCEVCGAEGKKTIAKWVCTDCTMKRGESVYICEDCTSAGHGEHYLNEIAY